MMIIQLKYSPNLKGPFIQRVTYSSTKMFYKCYRSQNKEDIIDFLS